MSRTKGSKNRQKRGSQTNHPAKVQAPQAEVQAPQAEAIEQTTASRKTEELKAVKVDKPVEVPKPFETVKPYEEKTPEPLKPANVSTGPEATETVQEIKEPQFLNKFWFGNVFVPGVGTVNGRVRDDHYAIFIKKFESGQSKLPKADRLTLNINYWVRDNDELDKKLQEGKKQQA